MVVAHFVIFTWVVENPSPGNQAWDKIVGNCRKSTKKSKQNLLPIFIFIIINVHSEVGVVSPSRGQRERQEVGFGCQYIIFQIHRQIFILAEEHVQVFESFSQYERIHSILVYTGPDIVDRCITTLHLRMLLEGLQHRFPDFEVMVVFSSSVQEVSWL